MYSECLLCLELGEPLKLSVKVNAVKALRDLNSCGVINFLQTFELDRPTELE